MVVNENHFGMAEGHFNPSSIWYITAAIVNIPLLVSAFYVIYNCITYNTERLNIDPSLHPTPPVLSIESLTSRDEEVEDNSSESSVTEDTDSDDIIDELTEIVESIPGPSTPRVHLPRSLLSTPATDALFHLDNCLANAHISTKDTKDTINRDIQSSITKKSSYPS